MRRRKGLSFYQKQSKISTALIHEIMSWVFGCVIAVLLAFVLVFYFGMSTSVIGISMEPTLSGGQSVLIDRFLYTFMAPKQGDVIAFLPNGDSNAHYYIKRVVATSGDTVQIKDGILLINGKPVYNQLDKIENPGIAEEEVLVGTDECFVIGDNCNNSEDSRSANIGLVKKQHIIGKVWFHMASESDGIGFVKKE